MWSILTYQWNSTTIKITNIFIAFRSFSQSIPNHYISVISWSVSIYWPSLSFTLVAINFLPFCMAILFCSPTERNKNSLLSKTEFLKQYAFECILLLFIFFFLILGKYYVTYNLLPSEMFRAQVSGIKCILCLSLLVWGDVFQLFHYFLTCHLTYWLSLLSITCQTHTMRVTSKALHLYLTHNRYSVIILSINPFIQYQKSTIKVSFFFLWKLLFSEKTLLKKYKMCF